MFRVQDSRFRVEDVGFKRVGLGVYRRACHFKS